MTSGSSFSQSAIWVKGCQIVALSLVCSRPLRSNSSLPKRLVDPCRRRAYHLFGVRGHERQAQAARPLRHRGGPDSVDEHPPVEQRPGNGHRVLVGPPEDRHECGGRTGLPPPRLHLPPERLPVLPPGRKPPRPTPPE